MIRHICQTFVASLIIFATMLFANAQEYNCNNPQFQQEMNYCSAMDYEEADRILNQDYQMAIQAMKELDRVLIEVYRNQNEDLSKAENTLRQAQRNWLKYRDVACETEGFLFYGGTMESMIVSGCLERLTRQRSKDLRFLFEFYG